MLHNTKRREIQLEKGRTYIESNKMIYLLFAAEIFMFLHNLIRFIRIKTLLIFKLKYFIEKKFYRLHINAFRKQTRLGKTKVVHT